jgi:hypothetical protein
METDVATAIPSSEVAGLLVGISLRIRHYRSSGGVVSLPLPLVTVLEDVVIGHCSPPLLVTVIMELQIRERLATLAP